MMQDSLEVSSMATGAPSTEQARRAWVRIGDVAHRRLERGLELAAIFGALATIPITIAQENGSADSLVEVGNWIVWGVFFVEYVVLLALSPDRRVYTRRNWLNVAVVVLTFPVLPPSLEVLRLARLVRLLRLIVVLWEGFQSLGQILGRHEVAQVGTVSAFLVLAAGGILGAIEPDTVKGDFWNGVWWALVTVTSVGYGDVVPASALGKLLAAVLMLTGLGLISTLAASVAAHFIGKEQEVDLATLERRLDRIERLLEQVAEPLDQQSDGRESSDH